MPRGEARGAGKRGAGANAFQAVWKNVFCMHILTEKLAKNMIFCPLTGPFALPSGKKANYAPDSVVSRCSHKKMATCDWSYGHAKRACTRHNDSNPTRLLKIESRKK